jgi:hypothetical protein
MNQTETNGSLTRRGIGHTALDEAMQGHMSKESLGLGPLVDAKRWKYGIPDIAFFNQAPAFNKILVAQIPETGEETDFYSGTKILKTEVAKKRDHVEAPRGVLVSAGLQALDELRSNGIDIGHTIGFTRLAPFRRRCGVIAGQPIQLIVLVAGDVVDSEDLGYHYKRRSCRIVAKPNDQGVMIHQFVDDSGKLWSPVEAAVPEDS